MNRFHRTIRRFSGVLLALGLLAMPLAFAHASGSASITSLSPSSTIDVGTGVDFTVQTSGFTNPTYQINDSFSGTSVTSSDFNPGEGYFAWTPISSDVGTHDITFNITDSSGDSTSATQQIIVNQANTPALAIQNISPGTTVNVGQEISFSALAVSFTETPTYSVSDNFSGSSLNSSNINGAGEFTWTPTSNDVGTHTITITATNPAGNSASVEEAITVTGSSTTTTSSSSTGISIQSPSTLSAVVGQAVTFSAAASNLTGPAYTLSDSSPGSTIANADINSSGAFNWTPTANDVGSHSLIVTARSNDGATASTNVQIDVLAQSPATVTITTPSTYDFTTTLSLGMQSQDVTNLQTLLTKYELYSGPITGYFGSETETAVEAFQTAHNLPAVGTVGPLTLAALNQLAGTEPSIATTSSTSTTSSTTTSYDFTTLLSAGSTGAAVTALQQKLTSLGIYSGPITGYYGSLTGSAVETFQTDHGISAVGYVGPATRAALNS